jgi:diguanylate cyclase (GGDEF)-like protein
VGWSANELVPLADRLRYMRFLRVALVAVIAAVAGWRVGGITPQAAHVWSATFAYVGISAAGEGAWRLWKRRGLWLFGGLLVLDAGYLVLIARETGGSASPLRYLILLHLVAVALLASYRTGLKLVVWYVLLLLLDFQVNPHHRGTYAGLVFFVGILATVTLGTAALSAVNERELRRRRFDLEALAALATDLEDASEPQSVAAKTVASVVDNFGLERVAVVALSPRPHLLAGHGLREAGTTEGPGTRSVIADACRLRATLLPAQLSPADDPWLSEVFAGAHNLVVAPLTAEGGALGALVFEHGSRRGSRIERRLLTIIERFASHTALALRNAMLLERVQQAAATDALTGVANRRAFEEVLEREVARATRTGEPVSLVMLDLDHFKDLNDTHGHQMGDRVLREVAQALAAHCREMDFPARYGGEEFAVILPNCGVEEVQASAQRLWSGVAEGGHAVPLTASAGFATFPDHATTGRELIGAADEALYRAKRAGRNQLKGSLRVRPRTHLGIVASQIG